MNKYIHTLYIVLFSALASCTTDENPAATENGGHLGQVSIQATMPADTAPHTRASAADIKRYAVSVFADADYTEPAAVFGTPGTPGIPDKSYGETTDGTFSMTLDRTKTYYCIFWADNGTGYTLNDPLDNITVTDGSTVSEAFCGKLTIPAGTTATYSVTLKRAVAKITLLEKSTMPAGRTLTVTYKQPVAFNMKTEVPIGNVTEKKVSFTTVEKTGTDAAPVSLYDGDIFILAPIETASLISYLTFQCDDEVPTTISNVPLQANRNTNITGHYTKVNNRTFHVDVNGGWTPPDNDENL